MLRASKFRPISYLFWLLVFIPVRTAGQAAFDNYTYVTEYWRHSVVIFKNLQRVETLVSSGTAVNTVGITPDGTRAYVTNCIGGSISVFVVDPSSRTYRKEIAVIKTGEDPVSLRIHPEGMKLYAVGGRRILVVDSDPESQTYNTVVKTVVLPGWAFDLDLSPEADRLFVANYSPTDEGFLSVLDTVEDELVDADSDPANGITPIPIGHHEDRRPWFKCMRIGSMGYGYVLNHSKMAKADSISVFDSSTMLPYDVDDDPTTTSPGEPEGISTIEIPGTLPVSLCFSPDGTRLYVTERDTSADVTSVKGKVMLIDADPASPKFNRILRISEAGLRPEGAGVSADGRYVMVSCRWSHFIRVFDKLLQPITSIPMDYSGEMASVLRPKIIK